LRRWLNAKDITDRPRGLWIVDFGCDVDLDQASKYEAPFEYVKRVVAPKRAAYRTGKRGFWCFERPRPEMRSALAGLFRYLATPLVSKHRVFTWLAGEYLPANLVIAFARDDDYFFGVLHSAVHERWSRRMGTQLREAESGCRYTPTTCFETFPFPPLAGGIAREADAANEKQRQRIAVAATKLNELRENWLNPKNADGSPALSDTQLKKRTLTNLYNDRPTWLELAHLELDRAVLAAYGWPEDWAEKLQPKRDEKGKVNPILGVVEPAIEQEVLGRLLALNLALAGGG
ncbi:MAG TPA: type IIL restriction-modification enzyme MmeI, partial [Phycisphaerae bacterium]|nr:type IIL restriction-modification enzyme MmeI [Phycisphaerae bacterium]